MTQSTPHPVQSPVWSSAFRRSLYSIFKRDSVPGKSPTVPTGTLSAIINPQFSYIKSIKAPGGAQCPPSLRRRVFRLPSFRRRIRALRSGALFLPSFRASGIALRPDHPGALRHRQPRGRQARPPCPTLHARRSSAGFDPPRWHCRSTASVDGRDGFPTGHGISTNEGAT
jgi:hypothetical protein